MLSSRHSTVCSTRTTRRESPALRCRAFFCTCASQPQPHRPHRAARGTGAGERTGRLARRALAPLTACDDLQARPLPYPLTLGAPPRAHKKGPQNFPAPKIAAENAATTQDPCHFCGSGGRQSAPPRPVRAVVRAAKNAAAKNRTTGSRSHDRPPSADTLASSPQNLTTGL